MYYIYKIHVPRLSYSNPHPYSLLYYLNTILYLACMTWCSVLVSTTTALLGTGGWLGKKQNIAKHCSVNEFIQYHKKRRRNVLGVEVNNS